MGYGFVRIAAVSPQVNVADCGSNVLHIIEDLKSAENRGATIIVFPELCVTAYTCGDLFAQSLLLDEAENCLVEICKATAELEAIVFVGCPIRKDSMLYNCAVAINKGKFIGVVPKTFLPNYKEFYEKRWFTAGVGVVGETVGIKDDIVPFGTDLMFSNGEVKIAAEICEDLWTAIPPSCIGALNGANVIVNLSATNELIGKHDYLMELIKQQSARCIAAYAYASSGFGESTTDVVFAGNTVIVENGTLLSESERFLSDGRMSVSDVDVMKLNSERRTAGSFADSAKAFKRDYRDIEYSAHNASFDLSLERTVARHPFVPSENKILNERCEEIINIQVEGLMRRLEFTRIRSVVVGVSGGLDSTLALLVSYRAFKRLNYDLKRIVGITMPGFGTTDRTYKNALDLMGELGITTKEISITEAVKQHFSDIGHDINVHDVTYENSQARERTQILMDYSNKINGIVIGTGDLSELALGWATYNGDHMSMYGVNASIPKTLVCYLVRWFALNSDERIKKTLLDIVDTPISPELIPSDENGNIKQKTENLVGPYELHDFFLYYMLRFGFSPQKIYFLCKKAFEGKYENAVIKKWLREFYRRFFQQQFKRSCLPDGPKVGSVSLSPRGDWRMPSDASAVLWLAECDKL